MRSIIIILLLTAQVKAFSQSNSKNMNNYLKETPILNYSDSSIQSLVKNKNWLTMDTIEL
jgi:hypothetical protein